MGLGAAIGAFAMFAVVGHMGYFGIPWLVNVALFKLSFIASAGLMFAGASTVRLDRRREQERLALAEHTRDE